MDDDSDGSDEPAGLALPDLSVLGAGGLGGLLEQAQQVMAAQQEAAELEVEGVAGGGVVKIRATGSGQVLGVTLAPEVVDPADIEMLEDLIVAALHDVNEQLAAIQRAAMGSLGDLFG